MKWKHEKFVGLFKDVSNRRIWFRYFSKPPFPLDIFWGVLEIVQGYISGRGYGDTLTFRTNALGNVFCTYLDLSPYIREIEFYHDSDGSERIYIFYKKDDSGLTGGYVFFI